LSNKTNVIDKLAWTYGHVVVLRLPPYNVCFKSHRTSVVRNEMKCWISKFKGTSCSWIGHYFWGCIEPCDDPEIEILYQTSRRTGGKSPFSSTPFRQRRVYNWSCRVVSGRKRRWWYLV